MRLGTRIFTTLYIQMVIVHHMKTLAELVVCTCLQGSVDFILSKQV